MKITIRADGGHDVGWGHLGRCSALAEALVARGASVFWASRADPAISRFTGGEPALPLPGKPSMAQLPLGEAMTVGQFSDDHQWIIIDHYGASEDYIEELRRHSRARILLLDDHQVRMGADLRLSPNQGPRPDTLSGVAHQLVRRCFTEAASGNTLRDGWLIALGGADLRHDLRRVLMHLLKRDGVPTRRLTVIANKRSTEEQQLDAVLSRWKRKVEVHTWVEPQGLADLFAGHEAALVSASTLAFEALATSTPIIALRTADNQARLGAHLQEMGIHVFDDTSDAAQGLIDGKASRQNDDTPFDGLGIWRVADALGIHQ